MEPSAPFPSPIVTPTSSVFSRLLNVIASPAEVYEEVRDSAYETANWLVPTILAAAAGLVLVLVAFAQPAVRADLRQQQSEALDRSVERGKMTAAQADAARQGLEKMGPMLETFARIGGSVGAVIGSFVATFVCALFLWMIARFGLKTPVGYWKCMEVVGLASIISALASILTLFMIMMKGSISANLSPASLINGLRPGTPAFALWSGLNPIYLWWSAVISLGLAKLTGTRWGQAAVWVFGTYVVLVLLAAAASLLGR